jgi:hypothetical protein
MRLLAVFFAAFALAGCGVVDDEGPAVPRGPDPAVYGPTEPKPPGAGGEISIPELRPPTEEVARELDAGAIAVVDITGAVGVRPDVVETATDMVIEGVTWDRWGEDGAEGHGEARWLDCQSTCANGQAIRIPATITLSGVRECKGRRYYEAGAVTIDPSRTPAGEQPATYVRAPC